MKPAPQTWVRIASRRVGATAHGGLTKVILWPACSTAGGISHLQGGICYTMMEWRFQGMSSITTVISTAPLKSSTRNRPATAKRPTRTGNSSNKESPEARELRKRIFPTLYAIFQQSRGQEHELKIKNRSLRSLTRSCLYLKSEDQLQRTLQDAEALFNKYCSLSLKE